MNVQRLLLMIIFNFFYAFQMFFDLLKMEFSKNNDRDINYKKLRKHVIRANKGGRIKVNVEGIENLPKEKGYLICPNHQGYYDALAIIEAHKESFGFVVKKEVKNIFLIRQVIKGLKSLSLDRDSVKESIKMIDIIKNELLSGENYLIFPEGTRSKKGNEINNMKPGAYKAAIKAKAPIVPVALINCFIPFDKKGINKVNVYVEYLKPLYYEDYKDLNTTDIAYICEEKIKNSINRKLMLTNNLKA